MATKMTYKEQLLHPNWQRKRLEMLNAAGWTCASCGGAETTLHVHHRRYIKGRMAWEYADEELQVLCATCHEEEHVNRALLERLIAESDYGSTTLHVAIGLLSGYLDASLCVDPGLARMGLEVDGHSYDLGVLAAMAAGAEWGKLARAARVVLGGSINPAEQGALDRWEGRE